MSDASVRVILEFCFPSLWVVLSSDLLRPGSLVLGRLESELSLALYNF